MNTIKRINIDTIGEFAEKIEAAKGNFIPMLPYVKLPFHDFNRYKTYSDKGIYLIDYLEEGYCLYHFFHLTEGDDTLRATLILPSDWDKRFELIEKSIPNLVKWFMEEDTSKKFIIQSLEYGEIEYYPTLSHYLIPTIIKNGFNPKYRMYMRRDAASKALQITSLNSGFVETTYSEEMKDNLIDFYFSEQAVSNYQYFTNCTLEELQDMLNNDFTKKYSKFIVTDKNEIVAGVLISIDQDKMWIDNFMVNPKYSTNSIGDYLLGKAIKKISEDNPDIDLYIYLNRDCFDAISTCEKNGFVAFEFWTDMIFER